MAKWRHFAVQCLDKSRTRNRPSLRTSGSRLLQRYSVASQRRLRTKSPLVEAIQRKDRDLASQVRRAVSSIALNAAEAQGNAGGNSRLRFESALGSLYEAQAGVRLAVAWGYFSQTAPSQIGVSSGFSFGSHAIGLLWLRQPG